MMHNNKDNIGQVSSGAYMLINYIEHIAELYHL